MRSGAGTKFLLSLFSRFFHLSQFVPSIFFIIDCSRSHLQRTSFIKCVLKLQFSQNFPHRLNTPNFKIGIINRCTKGFKNNVVLFFYHITHINFQSYFSLQFLQFMSYIPNCSKSHNLSFGLPKIEWSVYVDLSTTVKAWSLDMFPKTLWNQ